MPLAGDRHFEIPVEVIINKYLCSVIMFAVKRQSNLNDYSVMSCLDIYCRLNGIGLA